MSAVQGIEIDREELESHWLPFTDNKSFKDDPRLFVKGEGVYLWNQHGSRLLAVSYTHLTLPTKA